ncbi:MFS transporter [Acinetobacter sp.]|uniref:MFS transporter n=1 Tax=Acinetobacter sp. TaxID=472 RepID=UPI003D07127C
MVFTQSITVLINGGIGISSFAASLYVSEVAPRTVGGKAISIFNFMITFDILATFFRN